MMRRILALVMILVLAVSLAACGGNSQQNNIDDHHANIMEPNDGVQDSDGQAEDPNQSEQEEPGEQSAYPLTVTDASGLTMVFEAAPQRIVSLSPSETEVLFALGLEERIVGVTEWCDYPEEALHKAKVGSFDGNAETIIAAEPDLVVGILSLNNPEYVENYRSLGLTVFTSEPRMVQEAMDRILLLGQMTDTEEKAEQVVAEMQRELDMVVNAVNQLETAEKKKVLIEYNEGWTVGKGEFMDELITLAGGINIANDLEGWVQISEETIIARNPDVILYPTYMEGIEDIIKSRSGWDKIHAVLDDRLHGIDDDLISRPGPRLTQGLIEIGQALYPELVSGQ